MIAVKHQTHGLRRPPVMDGLLEGIQNEPSLRRGAGAPADDLARVSVDDEGDIDEPLPGGDIGEITDPQHVGRRDAELAVQLVQRARGLLVRIVVRCGLPRMMP